MILLDQPYASHYLLRTIAENGLPTLDSPGARAVGLSGGDHVLDETACIEAVRRDHAAGRLKLYSNSENALGWVAQNLQFTGRTDLIAGFKDKAAFRRRTASLTPGFDFREVPYGELAALDPVGLDYPLILKPSVGFFSVGVRRIDGPGKWSAALAELDAELASFRDLLPRQVLDTRSFLIEPCVEGREFAIDAYYDAQGEPVLLNLLEHYFSSQDDVGDRVYSTSGAMIREHGPRFEAFLAEMGRLTGARDIPVHVELRITAEDRLFPIEVNPLRFGGWCTTADLAGHAFGFNPYLYYLQDRRPDWDELLAGRLNEVTSLIVLNNSTGWEVEDIAAFDYEALQARFSQVLELRRFDHRKYRFFGFVFVRTGADSPDELEAILHSDLREFVKKV